MGAPHTTPGPWMISAGPSSVVGWPIVSHGSEHAGRSIGNLSWMPGLPEDVERTIRANGHQMAASPGLYDACAKAAEVFREYAAIHSAKIGELGPGFGTAEFEAIQEKVKRNEMMAGIMEMACAVARGEHVEQDR